MFEYLYTWIQNIAYYLVIVTAALQLIPNKDYRKYVQFFTGLVLILLVLSPILKIFGEEDLLLDLYGQEAYESRLREFREQQEEILQQEGPEEGQNIEVGEITVD